MKTYFEVVIDLVGIENICNGPSNGPVSQIKFINGFVNIPTEEEIQAKIAELQAAEPLRLLRIERDRLLQQTDWIITKGLEQDMDLAEWKTYRQALRDLPATAEPQLNEFGNLTNVEWPTPPENS